MKKRILFLAQHFITLYSFRRELIERLCREGHEVYLSIPDSEDNVYFEKLGCRIVPTSVDRRGTDPVKDLKLILFYRAMVQKLDPDVIFSYTIKPNIYGALATNGRKRRNGKPYRLVCNITGTGETFLKNSPVSRLCRVLYRHSVRHCYKVYFQNTHDRDMFIRSGMVGDNWEMLPGSGVNLEQFTPAPMPEGEGVSFIFIGRVMRLKGIEEFVAAAEMTRAKHPETRFYIAGFVEEEEYRRRLEESDAVIPLGFQKNISEWIARCHCTILPSHGGEGVPNVLLESAASGRICIGSRTPGTEDVIDEGVTGYLFEAGNAEDLAAAVEKVIAMSPEERAAMGAAGRAKVEKEFDREIVIGKYMEEVDRA